MRGWGGVWKVGKGKGGGREEGEGKGGRKGEERVGGERVTLRGRVWKGEIGGVGGEMGRREQRG